MTGFIFDMDGVIVDTSGVWEMVDQMAFPDHKIDRQLIRHLLSGTNHIDGTRILLQHLGIVATEVEVQRLAEQRKQFAIQLYGQTVQFIPGFTEFFPILQAVAGAQLRTAIATAAQPEYLAALQSHLDLRRFFGEHIYSIAEVGNRSKPAPDIFLYAASQIGADPQATIVLEDAINGIEAAKAAGMYAIGIATTHAEERLRTAGADLVVPDYASLSDLLIEMKELSREQLHNLR